uniref:HA domain-containing protein n=1 Tax=Heterorhabditis bacteriophora TaxID=37862 RepID=A0A1I7XR59_HETBA
MRKVAMYGGKGVCFSFPFLNHSLPSILFLGKRCGTTSRAWDTIIQQMLTAAAMATQLLQNPSLFGLQNRNHNGAMMNGGMGSGRRGRKRKFSPEERMLLAQLYHDHFTIYHSKRYVGPDYIDTEASLKFLLLRDWAQKLSNLGVSERGTMDIGNRINEMIMEVADFRNVTNISYNTQMSPSFLLFNKVYDYIYLVHESVERLLDAYEIKLCKDEEESILNAVNARKRKEWTTDEKKALSELYTSNAAIYNELPIRKKDHAAREALLKLWSTQISQIGVAKRTPEEIQAVIYTYRCMVGRSPADEPDTAWKTRGAKRRKRERSPTLEAVQAAGGVFPPVDDSMTVEKLFEEVKKVQDELMQDHPKREEERYEKALIMKKAVQLVSLEPALPQPAQPITAHTPSPAGRTNRPHMSRHEKHLLGMLYRKDHSDYETYNNPHVARKTPKNRKWQLLTTWAEKLTNLGVSKREPDELATKISQYKNIIKNHYQCMDGISLSFKHTVNFSNEYKLRRCLRPLSPTTRLYDISQEVEELINDDEIEKYAKQAIDLRRFPMHFGMNLDAETNFSVYQPYKKDLMVKRLQTDEEDQSNDDKLLQIKEEPSEDVSPSTSVLVQSLEAKPLNLATIMKASRTIRDLEQNTYSKMYDTIYDDIKNMEARIVP